jgi:hypothetical protein
LSAKSLALYAIKLAKSNTSTVTALMGTTTVTEATNAFACDLTSYNNFILSITNTTSKTISFSNIPAGLDFGKPVTVQITTTAAAVIGTYPTGTVWQNGIAPTYNANKTYYLTFIRRGSSWDASVVGEY